MDIPTHYTTLGLAPTAPDAVIRAAYRALSLIHHPDKTLHLPASERAKHAAIFRAVQEAYDVLGSSSKAAYDIELARHGNRVDETRSTFHRATTSRTRTRTRSSSIRLSTPEEKRTMKAKVEQNLAYIREQRAKSDAQDADMDIAGLKSMYKIWSDLVNEHKNDQAMQVYCASQLEAYETKIAQREKEHAAWLKNMSKPKNSPETLSSKTSSTSAPGAPHRPAAPRFTNAAPNNPTPPSILCQRADERKRAEAQRMEQLNNRAQARAEDKARKDAAKQAHLDAKAAAIRAEKEKQKHKADEQARQAAECIANARAKVYVAPKGNAGDSTLPSAQAQDGERVYKSAAKKLCGKCGAEHPSFAEWRKCNLRGTSDQQAKVENEEVDEGVFFHVV